MDHIMSYLVIREYPQSRYLLGVLAHKAAWMKAKKCGFIINQTYPSLSFLGATTLTYRLCIAKYQRVAEAPLEEFQGCQLTPLEVWRLARLNSNFNPSASQKSD